jgi:uncharacterized protein YutE (UPF0331/DUF86 family)
MLLYCMTEVEATYEAPSTAGVRGAAVEWLTEAGVRCFFSRIDDLPKNGDSFRTDALQFHAVLRNLLQRATVLPFRFPTLLEGERHIREFLTSSASEHLQELQRLRGRVQVEVRILFEQETSDARTGKAYLEERSAQQHALQAQADAAFSLVHHVVQEWKTRREHSGIRCYALVEREQVQAFEEQMRTLSPVEGTRIIVSGPWPATEFLHVQRS